MPSRTIPVVVFVLLLAAGLGYFFLSIGDLPARVVTQMNSAGAVETSLPKAGFAALWIAVLVFCMAYFIGFGLFIHKLPARYFKVLPDRERWMSAEEKPATLAHLSCQLLWLGVATLVMFLGTFWAIVQQNTTGLPLPFSTVTSLLSTFYLTFVFIGVVRFRARFRSPQPPQAPAA